MGDVSGIYSAGGKRIIPLGQCVPQKGAACENPFGFTFVNDTHNNICGCSILCRNPGLGFSRDVKKDGVHVHRIDYSIHKHSSPTPQPGATATPREPDLSPNSPPEEDNGVYIRFKRCIRPGEFFEVNVCLDDTPAQGETITFHFARCICVDQKDQEDPHSAPKDEEHYYMNDGKTEEEAKPLTWEDILKFLAGLAGEAAKTAVSTPVKDAIDGTKSK
jgi:hypothetical protein